VDWRAAFMDFCHSCSSEPAVGFSLIFMLCLSASDPAKCPTPRAGRNRNTQSDRTSKLLNTSHSPQRQRIFVKEDRHHEPRISLPGCCGRIAAHRLARRRPDQGDRCLDFAKPFMSEGLARVEALNLLTPREQMGGCSGGTLDFNFFVENGLAEFLKPSQWLRTTYEAPYQR